MGDDRVVISSGVAITPESIVNRAFASAFRGYDHGEVRTFLKRAADELAAALAREAELRQALQDALERAAHPQLDEGMLTTALGEHAARLLTSSREAAASTVAEAETRAARVIGEAESKIARVRAEADSLLARRAEESERITAGLRQAAEADARALRERARAEAEAEVESARVQGREMVQEARSVRERMLADLSRRRHGAEAQIEQLRMARERLLEAYAVVRRTIDEATAELSAADLGTRVALEAPAGRSPVPDAGGVRPEEREHAAEAPAHAPGHAAPVFAPREPGAASEPAAPAESPPPEGERRPSSPAPSPPAQSSPAQSSPAPSSPAHASPGPQESRATTSGPQPIIAARPASEQVPPVDDLARARAASASTGNGTPASAGLAPGSRSEPATVTPLPTRTAPRSSPSSPSTPTSVVTSGLGATSPPASAAPSAAELYKLPPSARVGELFAQMRAAQDTTATEVGPSSGSGAGKSGIADPTGSAATGGAAGADSTDGADDVASEAALTSRDQLLDPVEVALARALKRVLQDEQNEVLDRLRRHRRPSKGSLPDLAAQTERYQAAAVGPLRQAAEAGVRMAAGGDGGSAPTPGGRELERWAADLSVQLIAPLRERLERVLDDGGSGGRPGDDEGHPPDATAAERVSAIYRQWKSERVELVARHHAHTALCRGLFAASPDGIAFRWVVDDDGPCPDCDDNALAGPVPKGRAFPTGQPHPPAHIGCRCLVLADPS